MPVVRLYACAVLALFAASLPTSARVWYVNGASSQAPADGSSFAQGFHTVQAGLSAAQSGDEVWVQQGTYQELLSFPSGVALYGGFAGTETGRDQANPVANPTILDGGGAEASIVDTRNASLVTLDGFTLQNAKGTRLGTAYDGGGVLIDALSSVTISRCTFRNISLYRGSPPLGSNGGAICALKGSVVTIQNNTFEGNQAVQGGAIALWYGTYKVQGNQFNGNSADYGGAIFARNGAILLASDNTFTNNGGAYGGGIYGTFFGVTTAITHNVFSGNTAVEGGACYFDSYARLTVLRNTFLHNAGTVTGGALYAVGTPNAGDTMIGGNAFLRNSAQQAAGSGGLWTGGATIVNNTVHGTVGDAVSLNGPAVVANNLVTQSSGYGFALGAAAGPQWRNNDAWGNTSGDFQGSASPPAGNLSADPLYFNIAADDIRIRSGSLCRDAGNNTDANGAGLTLDLEGQPRIYGTAVDIGADEVGPYPSFQSFPGNVQIGALLSPQPVVAAIAVDGSALTDFSGPVTLALGGGPAGAALHGTTTAYAVSGIATFTDLSIDTFGTYTLIPTLLGVPGTASPPFGVLLPRCYVKPDGDDAQLGDSWTMARKTISSAIAATAGPNGEVWVAAGTYAGNLAVPADVTLYGGFSGDETSRDQRSTHNAVKRSVIDGNGVAQCVRFTNSTGNGIDNFKLTGGIGYLVQKLGSASHREGGAVYINGASPSITNCLITGNTAVYGGGIAVEGGHPDIRGNTIALNVAAAAGTLFGAGGGAALSGGMLADNVIFSNSATGASSGGTPSVGGGILVSGSADVHNNTIVSNQSPNQQGDIYITGSPAFANNIIRNRAGIEKTSGNPAFSHNDYVRGLAVVNPLPDPTGTNGNINTSPAFVNEATGNYHLPAGSPLIDAGDNAAVLPGETDMDGANRVYNGTVDIGADEVSPVSFTMAEAVNALSIAGGLQMAAATDVARLDIQAPAGVDLSDAVHIARKSAGLEPNP